MDNSPYVNMPRPFSRYPPGFRPVAPPSAGGGSTIRRFGSLTNIYGTDSPVEWGAGSRAGSVAPSPAPTTTIPFSPVASPIAFSSSFAHGHHQQRQLFSPTYDNVPPPQQQQQQLQRAVVTPSPVNYPMTRQVIVQHPTHPQQQHQQPLQQLLAANGDHFLEKLRQHKNEIERWHQGAASRWEEEERRYANPATTMTSNGGSGVPRNLHKTVSDSRLIQNGAPQGREPLVMMMGRGSGVQQPPLTWRNPMMMTSSMSNGDTGLTTSRERERAVPIQVQLDEGRVLKIPVQNEWRSATLDRNGSAGYRASPERNTNGYGSHRQQPQERYQSATLPRGFERQQQQAEAAAAHPRWREEQVRGGRPWSPERDYSPVPQQQQMPAVPAAAAPPPPPPPPPPAGGVRIQQQPQPKQAPPPRPKSPYQAPAAISQGFHEELLSKIPVKAKEWHERTTSPFRPKSPGPARPEPPQHRTANGYANGHDAVMTRSFPGYDERRERSTIVSRPESPAAKLFSGLEERWKQLKEENQRQNEGKTEDGEDREMERRRGERQMEWMERERREEEKREMQRKEEERARWEEERRERQRREEELEEARRWREEEERRYRDEERRGRRERSEPRGILRLRSESPTKRNSGRRVVFNDEDDVVFLSREGSSELL